MIVYLAGKISANGWREKIVIDIADVANDITEKEYATTRYEHLVCSGPFFIACDHGCYHGDASHGVGAYEAGDEDEKGAFRCDGRGLPQSIVTSICKKQIMRSNFVFAYIDDPSCFGTLCEIGYAVGRNIPVAVLFANNQLKKDMWFVSEMANIVFDSNGKMLKAQINDAEIFVYARNIADLLLEGVI